MSVRSTLFAQLIIVNHAVADQLSEIYRGSDVLKASSTIDNWDVLQEIIDKCAGLRDQIYIILDAEDECRERHLAESIKSRVSNPPLKWLVTRRKFRGIAPQIRVDLTLSTRFIHEYTERGV